MQLRDRSLSMNGSSPSAIRVANAPCSWGVLEFDLPGKALGYAQVLDEIKETGYAGTELGDWGFMPTDPAALRRELDARGLELVGAFVPVAFAQEQAHGEGAERAVKTAQLMSEAVGPAPFIVLADDNGKDPRRTKLVFWLATSNNTSAGAGNGSEAVHCVKSITVRHEPVSLASGTGCERTLT